MPTVKCKELEFHILEGPKSHLPVYPSVAGMVLPLGMTGQLRPVKVNFAQVACGVALRFVVKVLGFWIAALSARGHRQRANFVAELDHRHEAVATGSVPFLRSG